MMTTKDWMMARELEDAREMSYHISPVWAMTNGERIVKCIESTGIESAKKDGYWICSIFEHGHRVEA
jgi:hypothetical protein